MRLLYLLQRIDAAAQLGTIMAIAELVGFLGANPKKHPRFLDTGYGVQSMNQKPEGRGDLRPWREPLAISTPSIGAARQTIYRMGRDAPTASSFWLAWSQVVHIARGFDASDPTERTFFTGAPGGPKWTDNIMALSAAPYPNTVRDLAVPQPTIGPGVALVTDGASGDAMAQYYVFTWVNDIGWESAPSPPTLGPAAKTGAVLNLTASESVPAGNYGVNRIRWYRTQRVAGTDEAEFLFLREYAIDASGMQDDARELGAVLASETWLTLPTDAIWLTNCWNSFAAALVGKAVQFCEPGYIYAWPIEYEYVLAAKPLAAAAFAQRLLVFTESGAEVFTGQAPGAMDQKPMNLAIIVSQRSLVTGELFCIWAAKTGLWYYGTDGYRNLVAGSMTERQWQELNPSSIIGAYLALSDRVLYVGFYNNGAKRGFVVDLSNPDGIYFLDKGYDGAYWDPLLGALFVLDGTTIKQWDAGEAFMTATFRGKLQRQVAETEAEWLELLAEGSSTVKVWVDGVERFNRTIDSGEHRIPDGTAGRDWQIEVSTSGAVQGVVIE